MEEPSTKGWRKLVFPKPTRAVIKQGALHLERRSLRHAQTFIVDRFDSIRAVRRQALGWLTAIGLLILISVVQLFGYQRSYSLVTPTAGGTYAEATIGPLETMNPILTRTPAEQSATRLIFSGLLSYDTSGHLRPELADSWKVENNGKRYVVTLKPDIKWHDGKPFTADDVVFTVTLIKNQLVHSPLYGSWSQIKVTKLSNLSLAFDLTRTYAAFPHALTFGILPKHLLGSISPEQLREADFNRNPVGTGPFIFNRLQIINPDDNHAVIYLSASNYYVRGKPKLDRMQIHVFKDSARAKQAFLSQEVNAVTDLTSAEVHATATARPDTIVYRTAIMDGMFAFLRNDSPAFSDKNVRRAFVMATDRHVVIQALHGYASALEGPLLTSQLPSMTTKKQPGYDPKQASTLLDQAGWVMNGAVRKKDGQPLTINLVTVDTGDYPVVVSEIKKQWEKLGATVQLRVVKPDDFQQTILLPRQYDALVYELELGSDPDVYAYWHSSQADPRGLNLSDYKSSVASDALSNAQLRLDMAVRLPKYDVFANSWLDDSPAIALYQPQLHYVTTSDTGSMNASQAVVNRVDRYRQVELWTADKSWKYASP